MTLPTQLDGLSEVRGALTVDPHGHLVAATPGLPGASDEGAAALAVALRSLAEAGATAGLGPLLVAHLKGTASSLVGGSRASRSPAETCTATVVTWSSGASTRRLAARPRSAPPTVVSAAQITSASCSVVSVASSSWATATS